jgi:hypothetical protein
VHAVFRRRPTRYMHRGRRSTGVGSGRSSRRGQMSVLVLFVLMLQLRNVVTGRLAGRRPVMQRVLLLMQFISVSVCLWSGRHLTDESRVRVCTVFVVACMQLVFPRDASRHRDESEE